MNELERRLRNHGYRVTSLGHSAREVLVTGHEPDVPVNYGELARLPRLMRWTYIVLLAPVALVLWYRREMLMVIPGLEGDLYRVLEWMWALRRKPGVYGSSDN